jgi:hypothetical protein
LNIRCQPTHLLLSGARTANTISTAAAAAAADTKSFINMHAALEAVGQDMQMLNMRTSGTLQHLHPEMADKHDYLTTTISW